MRMRTILQSHQGECGLACLAMISSAFGRDVDLAALRDRHAASGRGMTLAVLLRTAEDLGLSARAVRIELEDLSRLRRPSILHWDLQHFVVLAPSQRGVLWWPAGRAQREQIDIVDPGHGPQRLALAEVSRHFTGVAIEFEARADAPEWSRARPRARLRDVIGPVAGWRLALARVLGLALLLEMISLVAPIFSQLAIDEALAGQEMDTLTMLALCFTGLLFLQTGLGALRTWIVTLVSQQISFQWAGRLFDHLLRLPHAFFEARASGEIASRFRAMDDIRRTLTAGMVESLIDGVLAIGSLAMMFLYSPALASVSLGSLAMYGLLRAAAYAPFREVARRRLAIQALESTHFLESLRAIVPIRLFDRAASRRARWQNYLVDIQNLDLKNGRLDISFTSANTLLMGLENILVIWLAAQHVAGDPGGGFTVGMLLAYLSFKFQFASRVSRLIDYAIEWKMLSLHVERVSDIALATPESPRAGKDAAVDAHLLPPAQDTHAEALGPSTLEARGLRFRYGESDPWIIDGIDLRIEAGDCVAITGPSGCGKSTLVKLFLGLLVPTSGEVLLDGRPLATWPQRALRARLAAVMQDDLLLAGTIAENISFFDEHHDQAEVEDCARRAQIHDDIQAMPLRYHTRVGDLGSGLSGGQRQRLFVARALYRRPGLLVMDEATSHLDAHSERAVGAAIAKASPTRVIVAHREETLRTARRLVRMVAGRVVEDRPATNWPTAA